MVAEGIAEIETQVGREFRHVVAFEGNQQHVLLVHPRIEILIEIGSVHGVFFRHLFFDIGQRSVEFVLFALGDFREVADRRGTNPETAAHTDVGIEEVSAFDTEYRRVAEFKAHIHRNILAGIIEVIEVEVAAAETDTHLDVEERGIVDQ